MSEITTNYQVKKGDTLSVLAAQNGISVQELKSLNGLKSDTIFIGQKLIFQPNNSQGQNEINLIQEAKTIPTNNSYKIQSGESLSKIAQRFGCSAKEIAILNGIENQNSIKAGQTILIPSKKASYSPQTNPIQTKQPQPQNKLQTQTQTQPNSKPKVIMIDIGHGVTRKNGKTDVGAVAKDNTTELSINTGIAEKLSEQLQEKGYLVVFTDNTQDVEARLRQKKVAKADIFISLHANSGSPEAKGEEVLFNTDDGKILAQYINKGLKDDDTIRQRPKPLIKRQNLAVLKGKTTPSALVEVGFISNAAERKKLLESQDQIAKSIVNGVDSYFEAQEMQSNKQVCLN